MPGVVQTVLDEIGWKPTDIDVGCGHQVTKELVYGLAKSLQHPDRKEHGYGHRLRQHRRRQHPGRHATAAYEEGRIQRGYEGPAGRRRRRFQRGRHPSHLVTPGDPRCRFSSPVAQAFSA